MRAGEWATNTDIDCGEEFCGLPVQDIPIDHVIVHPGYLKQTYKHNIALIVLKNKLKYGGILNIIEKGLIHAQACFSNCATDLPARVVVRYQQQRYFSGLGQNSWPNWYVLEIQSDM